MNKRIRILSMVFFTMILVGCVNEDAGSLAPVIDNSSIRTTQNLTRTSHYTVRKGDTLYSISWSANMDFRDLAALNQLPAPYSLHPGQRLRLMGRVPSAKIYSKQTHAYWPTLAKSRSFKNPRWKQQTRTRTQVQRKPTRMVSKGTLNPPPSVKGWVWPTQGKIVKTYSPSLTGNKGIDISGQYGQPVLAIAPGKVVYRGSGLRGYGNLVIVKHSDNFLSAYAYNKHLLVSEGALVEKGQKIAEMGRSDEGKVLLHFEIRYNGKPVNPLNYLK